MARSQLKVFRAVCPVQDEGVPTSSLDRRVWGTPEGHHFLCLGPLRFTPLLTIIVSILPLEHLCSRRAAKASRGLSLQASSSSSSSAAPTTDGDANNKLFIVNNRNNLKMSCCVIKGLAGQVFEARIIELNICVHFTRYAFYLSLHGSC